MGLTSFAFDYIALAVKKHGLGGCALSVGRIDLYFELRTLLHCAAHHGFLARAGGDVPIPDDSMLGGVIARGGLLSNAKYFRERQYISDQAAFAALGFSRISSVDASGFEGADYIYDLNVPGFRETIGQEFDLVIEAGSLEHIFHTPNALANMQSVVAVGGCILHATPTNNSVDHGFYQFSPTLFNDYYGANCWEILQIDLTRYERTDSPKFLTEPPQYFGYTLGSLDGISQGGLDDKMYGTWVLARRLPQSTIGTVPVQGVYRSEWRRDRRA